MTPAISAILFDNDGVLVDTEPLFLKATQELLATVGVHVSARDYHEISMCRGQSVFEMASARGISDDEILDLRARRSARYSELIAEGVRVLDGVRQTLSRLHGEWPLAIVTSSNRNHFDEIHRQTDLMPFFDFVLADGDYAEHKPHPAPYLTAASRLKVAPENCLVIEDTERGLVSATAAGMSCVVIPNALTDAGNFGSAWKVLASMAELPPLLGSG